MLAAVAFVLAQQSQGTLVTPEPTNRLQWAARGRELRLKRQYVPSVVAYRQAVKLGTRDPQTFFELACSLARSGDKDGAVAALRNGLSHGYHELEALRLEPDLADLREDKRWGPLEGECAKRENAYLARVSDPDKAVVNFEGLDLFWKAYAKAQAASPDQRPGIYQIDYLDKGDAALDQYQHVRGLNSKGLAKLVDEHPGFYSAVTSIKPRLAEQTPAIHAAYRKLKDLYPEAQFPDCYVTMGNFVGGGTSSNLGLLLSAEFFTKSLGPRLDGLTPWFQRVVEPTEDFTPLVVHEVIHFQQKGRPPKTLLEKSVMEGMADFLSCLVSGSLIERMRNTHIWANAREREVWTEFSRDMDGTDVKRWLYASGTADRPDDLGYYVGYKVCESYFGRAADKRQAVKDMLTVRDYKAFFESSKYATKFGP